MKQDWLWITVYVSLNFQLKLIYWIVDTTLMWIVKVWNLQAVNKIINYFDIINKSQLHKLIRECWLASCQQHWAGSIHTEHIIFISIHCKLRSVDDSHDYSMITKYSFSFNKLEMIGSVDVREGLKKKLIK